MDLYMVYNRRISVFNASIGSRVLLNPVVLVSPTKSDERNLTIRVAEVRREPRGRKMVEPLSLHVIPRPTTTKNCIEMQKI